MDMRAMRRPRAASRGRAHHAPREAARGRRIARMSIVSAEPRLAAAARYGRLYIPLGTLVTAWEFLRANGNRGREQLCFLAGRAVAREGGPAAQVTSCVLPVTTAAPGYVTLTR